MKTVGKESRNARIAVAILLSLLLLLLSACTPVEDDTSRDDVLSSDLEWDMAGGTSSQESTEDALQTSDSSVVVLPMDSFK